VLGAARKHLGLFQRGPSTRMHIKNYRVISDSHIVIDIFNEEGKPDTLDLYQDDLIDRPLEYDEAWHYSFGSEYIPVEGDEINSMRSIIGRFNSDELISSIKYKSYIVGADLYGNPDAGFSIEDVYDIDLEYYDENKKKVPIKFHPPRR
jgi:hypothetical protein